MLYEVITTIEHRYPAPGSELTASRTPVPSEHGTFAIYLDAAPSPFGKDLTLLRVGLKGREIDAENRKPASLTFVARTSQALSEATGERWETVNAGHLLHDTTQELGVLEEVGLAYEPELREMGALAGGELYRMQLADRLNEPVLTQFLVESVVMSAIGGFLGVDNASGVVGGTDLGRFETMLYGLDSYNFV